MGIEEASTISTQEGDVTLDDVTLDSLKSMFYRQCVLTDHWRFLAGLYRQKYLDEVEGRSGLIADLELALEKMNEKLARANAALIRAGVELPS